MLSGRLAMMTGANPDLVKQPGLVVSLAQSPATDDQIKSIASLASVTNLRRALESIPADRALAIWNTLAASDRERLKASGYQGVIEKHEGKGLFGAIKSVVGGVEHAIGQGLGVVGHAVAQGADAVGLDTVGGALKDAGASTLHALNYVPDRVSQWVRAERMAEMEAGPGVLNMLRGDVRFWSNPGKYWSAAEDGNKVYDIRALEAIKAKSDPRLFQLAKLRADGEMGTIKDTLLKLQQSDMAGYEELAGLLSSHDYNDLADELNDAKISFGRDIARTLGIHQGSDSFNVVSGALDGTMRVLEDPLTYVPFGQLKYGKYAVAGSVGSRSAVMADPVQAAARIDQLFAQKAVQRGTADMGRLLERVRDTSTASSREAGAKALDDLKGKYGRWAQGPLLDALVQSPVKNTATFREFLDDSTAMSFLIRGQSAQRVKILPYRTARAEWVSSLGLAPKARWVEEGGRHRAIILAASTGLNRVAGDVSQMSTIEAESLGRAVRAASGGTVRGKATTASRRLTTRLPVMDKNSGGFAVVGPGSIDNFNRLAASMVPKFLGDRLTGVYATADVAGRKQIIKGLMDTSIRAYGLEGDAAGREVAKRMLRSFDDAARPAQYTIAGARTELGDEAAVYAHQMSEFVYMPNFREFATALAKVHHANGLLNSTNHPAVDWFTQKVWRPMILLRPALAFRNASEEMLNNSLRNGFLGQDGMFAQYAGAKVAQREFRGAKTTAARDAHALRTSEYEALTVGQHMFKAEAMFAGARPPAPPKVFTSKDLHEDFDGVLGKHEAYIKEAESSYNRRLAGLNAASAAARADAHLLGERIGVIAEKLADPKIASTRGDLHGEVERLRREAMKLTKTAEKTEEKAVALAHTADPAIQEARAALNAMRDRAGNVTARAEAAARLPHGLDADAGRMWRAMFFAVRPLHATLVKAHAPAAVTRKLDHRNWASAVDVLQARALARLGEGYLKTVDADAIRAIEDLSRFPDAAKILAEDVMGGARRSAQLQADMPDTAGLVRRRDGKWVQMQFVKTGAQKMNTAEDHGLQAWSIKLHELAEDPAAAEALRYADNPTVAIARVMAAHTEHRVYSAARWRSEPERWAQVVVNDVRAHLSDNAGEFNEGLWRSIVHNRQIDQRGLDVDRLAEATVDVTARPAFVVAPDHGLLVEVGQVNPLVPMVEGAWKFTGDMEATIARNSQMVGHYVAARKDLKLAENMYAKEVAAARAARAASTEPVHQNWTDAAGKLRATTDEMTPGSVQARWEPNLDSALSTLDRRFEIYPRPLHETELTPEQVASEEFTRRAWQDALYRTLEYVDNPDVRSQAAVLMRNVAPFYRAQEEFYRRWFNIGRYSPKAVWRAHLALDGAMDGGLIQDDPVTGQKIFVYPGTGALAQLMTNLGRKVGFDMQFVVAPGNLTGRLATLAPGFDMDQNIHPFSGPVLALPLQAVETLTGRKESRWAEKALLSKYGYDEKPYKGLVPSWVKTFWPNEAAQASATKQSIAALAMGGITLPESADASVTGEYWRLVKMHAKAIQMTKAIFGTTLPSFPRMTLDNTPTGAGQALGMDSFTAEFRDLATRYGYEQAYGMFASLYPTRIPMIVGKEDYVGGLAPPVSGASGKFMETYAKLLGAHPKAAAYIIPVGAGDFDADAWSMARGLGMFTSKSAEQYASDIATISVKREYYAQRDEYEKYRAIATANGDSAGGQIMDEMWRAFSASYQQQNPLMAEYLANGATRAQERKATLQQLNAIVEAPGVPPGAELNSLRRVLDAHRQLELIRVQYAGSTDQAEMVRRSAKAEFTRWLKQLADEGDSVAQRLYSGVFRGLEGE